MTTQKILITGAAGFIGMHVCRQLVASGHDVTGIDNLNAYYDTELKYGRLQELGINRSDILYNRAIEATSGFTFIELDINDAGNLMALFAKKQFDIVLHLAAQAGVRYSITNPRDYIESNMVGFFNMIEACRTFPVQHFIYASSSSVYGNNKIIPFSTGHKTDEPISLYAATKKSNELMAYTYAHLYKIPTTGLRFFTVYGPWGRPDMAYFSFTKNILTKQPIELYNNGNLKRDFTYVDDVATAIEKLLPLAPTGEEPSRLLNVGNRHPVEVKTFLECIEEHLQQKAVIINKPMQPGDVDITYADTSAIEALTGFAPHTPLDKGLGAFVEWYKHYYSRE